MAITWHDFFVRIDSISKKDVYIYFSLGLCLFLVACEINDVVQISITEETWKTTSTFTMALLLLHTIAFYSGILGYVYISQAKPETCKKSILALFAIASNIVAFILRITLEIACINFREEYYRLASESGK